MHGVLSHDDIPVALYNLAEDPYETNDLTANTSASGADGPSAADVQAVLDDMIQSFEQHWRERPVQFNSAMTCKTNNRFKQFPVEFCDARLGRTRVPGAPLTYSFMMKDSPASTHSSEEHHYAQAIIGTIDSCQFEFPFIADDDDRVCGHVMPEPINLKLLYKGTVTRMLGPYILCIALCLLVTAGAIIYGVLRCLCCRSKSVRADGLKKKNE